MPPIREQGTGRFKNDGNPSAWETFIENNLIVKGWLSSKPKSTRLARAFITHLLLS